MERRIQSAKLEKRQTHQLLPEYPDLQQQKQQLINRVSDKKN